MSRLRKLVDRFKPHFEKGGRFGIFRSTFDAFETFLFVPNKVTTKGAHIRDAHDTKRMMSMVVLALMPALLFGFYNTGLQHYRAFGVTEATALDWTGIWMCLKFGFLKILPVIVVSYGVGLAIEFVSAQLRGHEVNEGFLVTGMLIPMILPPNVPLWIVALATAFGVIFGKEIFGGTGMNIFNPALLARAFVFFSYTSYMSGDRANVAGLMRADGVDGFSGATPLTSIADGMVEGSPTLDFNGTGVWDWIVGTHPGALGETSMIAIMMGAAILLVTGVASWRIMLSVFVGGLGMGLIFNLLFMLTGSNIYMAMPAYYHLLLGGFAFGAVFMATDPVTAAQTDTGKWIYGLAIGVMAVLIRVVNPGYPEGIMLAILFMNAMAPLVDHYVVEANVRRRRRRLIAANMAAGATNIKHAGR
ncbi:MAG: NADH:ubiquinone reductase (Na(+)-transporting) subunit B [Rikenellaceae bacterium]|nr:NADH:ubiquinone reductase (Na(+)-transporting) subunit B [Rikenellaceae bacterium]MCL2692041.1 NADH:ubiquinone reductase (Na(+)-transporting) subunit B [Rikenellaceae bacterium]